VRAKTKGTSDAPAPLDNHCVSDRLCHQLWLLPLASIWLAAPRGLPTGLVRVLRHRGCPRLLHHSGIYGSWPHYSGAEYDPGAQRQLSAADNAGTSADGAESQSDPTARAPAAVAN